MSRLVKILIVMFLLVLYCITYWVERNNLLQFSFFIDSFNFILIYFSFTLLTRRKDLVFILSSLVIILSPIDLFENISDNKLLYLLDINTDINYNWFFPITLGITLSSLLVLAYEALVIIFRR